MTDSTDTSADALEAALRLLPDGVSDRELRLFNCACLRRVWHLLGNDAFRHAVEVAERHADGLAGNDELGRAVREVKRASGRRGSREWAVYHAVRHAPGSPRAEAAGVARNTADVARSGVPEPDRLLNHLFISMGTARGFVLTLFDSTPDGEADDRVIWSGDDLPADATPELMRHFEDMQRELREAEARDEADRLRAAADAEAALRAEVQRAEAERRAVYSAERTAQFHLLQDIVGPPDLPVFDDAWRTPTVLSAAEAIYADRAFDRMPALADLLEAAGCRDDAVLDHCRQPGEHARGCWVLDDLLGRA